MADDDVSMFVAEGPGSDNDSALGDVEGLAAQNADNANESDASEDNSSVDEESSDDGDEDSDENVEEDDDDDDDEPDGMVRRRRNNGGFNSVADTDDDTESSDNDDDDDPDDASINASILDGDSEGELENGQILYAELWAGYERRGQRLQRNKRRYEDKITRAREICDNLKKHYKERIGLLKTQLRALKRRLRKRRRPEPWQRRLRKHLAGPNEYPYELVYRAFCRQENLSVRLTEGFIHPDLTLVEGEVSSDEESLASERGDEAVECQPDNDTQDGDIRDEPILIADDAPALEPDPGAAPAPNFFDRLPAALQARIFRLVFVKKGLIHVLSRLDPFRPPRNFPEEDEELEGRESLIPPKFHLGTRSCVVTNAVDPAQILQALLVCKRWCYIGCHAFYGVNTFAFSSLGEFGRFVKGIGKARRQRLVNLEINWHGSLMAPKVTHKIGKGRRKRKVRLNQRTAPLQLLTMTRSLKTLVVHIAESAESRMRRKYEMIHKKDRFRDLEAANGQPRDHFQNMVYATYVQPNFRSFRSMRTVHGIDYLYQLRGMKWIRFKESQGNGHRGNIRDWSFLDDLNSQVTMPKTNREKMLSHFTNLADLVPNWDPSQIDVEIAHIIFTGENIDWGVDEDFDDDENDSDEDDDEDDSDVESHGNRPDIDMGFDSGVDMDDDDEEEADIKFEDDMIEIDSDESDSDDSGHGDNQSAAHQPAIDHSNNVIDLTEDTSDNDDPREVDGTDGVSTAGSSSLFVHTHNGSVKDESSSSEKKSTIVVNVNSDDEGADGDETTIKDESTDSDADSNVSLGTFRASSWAPKRPRSQRSSDSDGDGDSESDSESDETRPAQKRPRASPEAETGSGASASI